MPHPSTAAQVSALLQATPSLGGEALAERIQVSRAAIHKAVETLRKKGFVIQATAGSGYTLDSVPDLLCEEAVVPLLAPQTLGSAQWVHLQEVESTNTHAAALAREGAPHGTVVVAEGQTAGRGRRGRAFVSPSGTGIYLSAILRPQLAPRHAYRLTMCGAHAVLEVVQELGIPAGLKWPNDVLADGQKVCGILTELSADAERIHQAIVGIGLNVNARREDFPPPLQALATSLALLKKERVDRVQVCAMLLKRLTAWYDLTLRDWPAVVQHARKHSLTLGRHVRVRDGQEELLGRATDLDDEGALILDTAAGQSRVVAGDVEFV